ncbi:MAG: rhomboid family intramembrane serine protease [Spirochaetes bacterium]|nr:rhomboid family intramembrane serine protease [Spirochaetota bacterium]
MSAGGMTIPLVTFATVALTVAASVAGFRFAAVREKCLFQVGAIRSKGELHRLVTPLFLHGDWIHLAFNMFSFYSFSAHMEAAFGPSIVAAIYFPSGIIGNLLALASHRKRADYSALGASGAVAGIIFASIFMLPGGSVYVFPVPVAIPAWAFALLFMAVSLYGIGRGGTGIGHEAHLGGALSGIACAIIHDHSIIQREPLLLAALVVPSAALLVWFIARR